MRTRARKSERIRILWRAGGVARLLCSGPLQPDVGWKRVWPRRGKRRSPRWDGPGAAAAPPPLHPGHCGASRRARRALERALVQPSARSTASATPSAAASCRVRSRVVVASLVRRCIAAYLRFRSSSSCFIAAPSVLRVSKSMASRSL